MNRLLIVLAVLALLGGCKKKEEAPPVDDFRSDWKSLIEIRDAMCACKVETCAEAALARKTKWSTLVTTRSYKPSASQTKDLERISTEINNCMIKAMSGNVDAVSSPPQKPTVPATPTGPATVDQLIANARAFAPTVNPQLVVSWIDALYVDAEGKLDEDGELVLLLGPANASDDDPKRRIGAPVKKGPPPPTECMRLGWKAGWTSVEYACTEAGRDFGRCSVAEIWKRAIAKGAPAEGVAMVQLREEKPRRWIFTILDAPRNISIQHFFPDDCELALEKPQPVGPSR